MRHLILLAFFTLAPLSAAEATDLQRSEDWELQLSKASQLTKEHQFDAANNLYVALTEAADRFSFPLLLKAKCRNNHGAMLYMNGRYPEAESKYKDAATYWIRSVGEESDEHATTLNNLGEVYRQMGRFPDAEAAYRASLGIREALARKDQLRLASALNNLATAQIQAQNGNIPANLGVARTVSSLGEMQRAQRRMQDAEASFQRALRIKREILGPKHPDVATSLNNLAALRQDCGDLEGAEKLYLEAVEIREAQPAVDQPALAALLNNIGTLYRKMDRMQRAETYISRAIQIWEGSLGPAHPSLAAGLNNLAELLMTDNRMTDAEPLFRRSIAINEAVLGVDSPQTATVYDNLGVLFLRQDKAAGAEAFFRRALAARSAKFGGKSPLVMDAMHHLSQSLHRQGRFTEAERLLVEELTILEANQLQRSSIHGLVLAELAYVQFAQRRLEAGERYLREVSAFAADLPASQREQVGELYQAYARLLRGAKRNRDAERMDDTARTLLPR